MNPRKDSQDNNEKSSTAKITTALHEDNESKLMSDYLAHGTMSYHPAKPPSFTKEDIARFAELDKDIPKDGHNIRFDKKRKMYFYLPKDHPEYKEHPDPDYDPGREKESISDNSINCTII